MYHKPTNTGPLEQSFKSFAVHFYKVSLIKSFIDSLFQICDNWTYFSNDILASITYSESRMEIPEHYVDLYSKLTIKTPERRFFKFPVPKVP